MSKDSRITSCAINVLVRIIVFVLYYLLLISIGVYLIVLAISTFYNEEYSAMSDRVLMGILYGFIAASGIKMLIAKKIDFNQPKNIFVASVVLVAGIGGLTFKFGNPNAPVITITSVAVAMILGILLNFALKDDVKHNSAADIELENKERKSLGQYDIPQDK